MNPNIRIKTIGQYNAAVDQCKVLADAYYSRGESEVPDMVYDLMIEMIKQWETSNPKFTRKDSPTLKVGATPSSDLDKVYHQTPMLSIRTIKNGDQHTLDLWITQVVALWKSIDAAYIFASEPYIRAELKQDGMSLNLIYDEHGAFECAVTRGDGECGEDITEAVLRILKPPRMLKHHHHTRTEIRGEVMVSLSGFSKINEMLRGFDLQTYSSPRNFVSGLMRSKKTKLVSEYISVANAYFVAYDVGDKIKNNFNTQTNVVSWLSANSFQTDENSDVIRPKDALTYFEKISSLRNSLDFDIDGVVFKVDMIQQQQEMGFASTHPQWAVAYKFMPDMVQTTVTDVVFTVGMSGMVTSTVSFTPVNIKGVVIEKALVPSQKTLENMCLTKGGPVLVYRAGDTIPQVGPCISNTEQAKDYIRFATTCPACSCPLEKMGGGRLYCSNRLFCPGVLVGKLCHATSNAALRIPGFGPARIKALVYGGVVESLSDFLRLGEGELTPELKDLGLNHNLLANIQSAVLRARFDQLLIALCIPTMGVIVSKMVAKNLASPKDLTDPNNEFLKQILSDSAKEGLRHLVRSGEITRLLNILPLKD